MIDFSEATIQQLAVHRLGNKALGEEATPSATLYPLDEDTELPYILLDYFINSFQSEDRFRFQHTTDLMQNEVYSYCKFIFEQPTDFLQQSVHILRHLFEQSGHPKIKGGELYIAYLANCILDDEMTDAIGIFKSEQKDLFLRLQQYDDGLSIVPLEGVHTKKLDKGCIVFNTADDDGYRILSLESAAQLDLKYWREDFLNLAQVPTGSFHTRQYMDMCQAYAQQAYPADKGKHEKVEFLNKTIGYFANNEAFEMNSFLGDLLDTPEEKTEFVHFKQRYEAENALDSIDAFPIAPGAVKKMKRKFKNHIKLDNNIEIKLHNASEQAQTQIERGFDENKGMYYYKIFFNEED